MRNEQIVLKDRFATFSTHNKIIGILFAFDCSGNANFTSSNVHMSYFPEKNLEYFIISVLFSIMVFIILDGSKKQYCDITTLLGYCSALIYSTFKQSMGDYFDSKALNRLPEFSEHSTNLADSFLNLSKDCLFTRLPLVCHNNNGEDLDNTLLHNVFM